MQSEQMESDDAMPRRQQIRWHIAVFLAPAVLVYTAIMILPLGSTLFLSFYKDVQGAEVFVASTISVRCSAMNAGLLISGTL